MMITVTCVANNSDTSIKEEVMLVRTSSISAIRDYVLYFDTQKIEIKETAAIVRDRMRKDRIFDL